MSPDDEASLREVAVVQRRMEGRLDKVLDDHEQRLRRCERWVYALPATAIVAIGSMVVALAQWAAG